MAFKNINNIVDNLTKTNLYRGIDGAEFGYPHGQGSDPVITYKNRDFNYYDVEDGLWNDFLDYAKQNKIKVDTKWGANKNLNSPETDAAFDKYAKENAIDLLETLMAN